jgi:hypothetical protein
MSFIRFSIIIKEMPPNMDRRIISLHDPFISYTQIENGFFKVLLSKRADVNVFNTIRLILKPLIPMVSFFG